MQPVSPHLICRGAAEAIDFYVRAFGAVERGRFAGPNGKIMNAMIEIEGSSIMLVDENLAYGMKGPLEYGGSPVSMHVYVRNVDDFVARAQDAGGTVTMPAANQFWGDRFAMMRDPFGHVWSFATHIFDPTPDEMQAGAMAEADEGCGDMPAREA
ncbi:VOC family protein [Pseudohoeflea suaedae]|uniref:VOC family protein n=2 Tax=Pseudohoeflea suaedae TaxID=877384 RepID=A0A4R5PRA9_9HYPH|nr:VOC family protein [Pseudohoeflea suaedae]